MDDSVEQLNACSFLANVRLSNQSAVSYYGAPELLQLNYTLSASGNIDIQVCEQRQKQNEKEPVMSFFLILFFS